MDKYIIVRYADIAMYSIAKWYKGSDVFEIITPPMNYDTAIKVLQEYRSK